MTHTTLTGATRYRTERRWFKHDVLVLQVQEHTTEGPPDINGLPEYLSGTYWRDARVEDCHTWDPRHYECLLREFEKLKGKNA